MHGPEHHFLVPAVLLASYYDKPAFSEERASKIKEARRRAKAVLGGFCDSHGNCGAAVGVGIYPSPQRGEGEKLLKKCCTPRTVRGTAFSIIIG